jgi:predicted GTPase
MYAGVDYADIVHQAEQDADVLVWDGGNNDFPFVAPDLMITVVDPLRPGHEVSYHPGEVNLRSADIIVVNKLDSAEEAAAAQVLATIAQVNPSAQVVRAESPVVLEPGPSLDGASVLVVEDGPTVTHGGMAFGAGTVAARQAGAGHLVDPRPYAVGSIATTYTSYPAIGPVLPAMGYSEQQLRELGQTIRAARCDAVIIGTPVDLGRLVDLGHPSRRATYELREVGAPNLAALLGPYVATWTADRAGAGSGAVR